MEKTGSQVLDSICISEAEKQAVLTLIREEVNIFITLIPHEICHQFVCLTRFTLSSAHSRVSFQIITKEVEANDWKKKYESSRQEVTEMRLENMLLHAFYSAVMEKLPPYFSSAQDVTHIIF